MNKTVVAVFGSRDDAEAARQDLIGAGIPSDDIHLRGEGAGGGTDDRAAYWQRVLARTDAETDRHQYYAEAERRGNAALTIEDVEEHEAATIETSLAGHGVLDVEQLAEDWRSRGWRGYQANAPALSPSEFDEERRSAERARAAMGGDGRRCVRVFSVVVARIPQEASSGGRTSQPRTPK